MKAIRAGSIRLKNRKTIVWLRALLLIFSVGVSFVGIEVLFRLGQYAGFIDNYYVTPVTPGLNGIYQFDEQLGYVHAPEAFGSGIQINSLGLRGPEPVPDYLEDSTGVMRIAVLGDSVAFGYGIPEDSYVFPYILEEELRSRNIPVALFNVSVTGYNTWQEVELFERLYPEIRPHIVLLVVCLNDAMDSAVVLDSHDGQVLMWGADRAGIPGVPEWLQRRIVARSRLYLWLLYRTGGRGDGNVEILQRQALQRLLEMSQLKNYELRAILLPYLENFEPYAHRRKHQFMLDRLEDSGIITWDMFPELRQHSPSRLRLSGTDIVHFSPWGNIMVARAIWPRLASLISEMSDHDILEDTAETK